MITISPSTPCAHCGHIADLHRLDDATNVSPADPRAKFRCVGPDLLGSCDVECPDFLRTALTEGEKP